MNTNKQIKKDLIKFFESLGKYYWLHNKSLDYDVSYVNMKLQLNKKDKSQNMYIFKDDWFEKHLLDKYIEIKRLELNLTKKEQVKRKVFKI